MMRFLKYARLALVCMATALVSACATPTTMSPQGNTAEVLQEKQKQEELVFQKAVEEEKRVSNVAYPILKANASICEEKKYKTGMNLWNQYDVPQKYRNASEQLYALGDAVVVGQVYNGSSAQNAGIQPHDILIAINDKSVPVGKEATRQAYKIFDSIPDQQVKVTLNHQGAIYSKVITRDLVCDYGVVYEPEKAEVNAYADGKNIHVPRGMLRFTESDTELALVISHEIAHNAMGHKDKKEQNALAAGAGGLVVDILFAAAGVNTQGAFTESAAQIGAQQYSIEFEQEADYVGMYFLARAGYDTGNVANFWRRMSAEMDANALKKNDSHPTAPERFIAIEKTNEEIQSKKAQGKELLPEIIVDESEKKRVHVRSDLNG